MQIGGSASVMRSALDLMKNGEQLLGQASNETASGSIDQLAQTLLTITCAKQTHAMGVKLASIADETAGYVLDMLV